MIALDREMFRVLHLDEENTVTTDRVNQHGTFDSVFVQPRDVVADASSYGARALLLAHNHPTAPAWPSEADLSGTRQLVSVCAASGIAVLDHMIVALDGAFSMRAAGLMDADVRP
jgi:DNA repair protein RadC